MDLWLPGLGRQVPGAIGEGFVARHEHATPARGDDLVAVEREHPGGTEGAGGLAAMRCTEGFSSIFDQSHPVFLADRDQAPVVHSLSVKVDRHHGLGQRASTRPVLQLLGHEVRCQLPRVRITVDEDGPSADVSGGVGRRHEGESGHEHVVAGSHPDEQQRQVEGGRSARHRHGVGNTDATRQLVLEHVDVGSQWCDPTGVERLEQELPLLGTDIGR